MTELQMTAPAKINLLLRIVGRRADGCHLLEMVNVPLALADTLEIASCVVRPASCVTAQHFEHDGITLACDHPHVPLDCTNLCLRAALVMREAAGRTEAIIIHLTKRIPIGGGLGGGSTDAAAVLRGLNILWNLQWPIQHLAALGTQLGADVPFFCYGRPAHVRGIGEEVQIYPSFPKLWILLINPNIQVSTKWAYDQYDLRLTATPPHVSCLPHIFEGFEAVRDLLTNDLEGVTAVHYPVIQEMLAMLRRVGAWGALMSGSGATVFGLFSTREGRDAAAAKIDRRDWLVIPTESLSG